MESYAKLASRLAADLSCDVIVGHSLGANIAIELVSAGEFTGPVVLLSPSFSRTDESRFPRALDKLSRVLGHLPYSLMLKVIGPAMKSSLPAARAEVLANELKQNEPRFLRDQTHQYLAYLDRHGSLANRFSDAAPTAWVVYGEKDDVGITAGERALLQAAPDITRSSRSRERAISRSTRSPARSQTSSSKPSRARRLVDEPFGGLAVTA